MRRGVRLSAVLLPAGLVVLCLLLWSSKTAEDEPVFRLKQVSAFGLVEKSPGFAKGQLGQCRDVPDANVTAYPDFASAAPVYGSVRFGAETGRMDSGVRFCFALDESGGTGSGYDRLYFDLNRDLDLTDDGVLRQRKNPPRGALRPYSGIEQQVCYEAVGVPLSYGSTGQRPLEVMPRLVVSNSGFKGLDFVTTEARRGRIKIGGRKFDILLGHNHAVSGWFDHPDTALHLIPTDDRAGGPSWWGCDRLMAIHNIGGTLYRFTATPFGDKLTVRPYDGPLGTFEVGAGGRDLDTMRIQGSLLAENAAVAVGRMSNRSGLLAVESCRLPVGDYLPNYLTVDYGRLRLRLSQNYHSDGKRMTIMGNRPAVYAVGIREGEPYVFDFSNRPVVMFVSPAKEQRVKIGDELKVMAVLTDPVLDTMIRGLDKLEKADTPPGEETTSLDPKVVITRDDGEVVAEGVMPFG